MKHRLLRAIAVAMTVALVVLALRDQLDRNTPAGGEPAPAGPERVTVQSTSDGDTVRLDDGRKVRLVQIDAPERGECFYEESRSILVRLAPRGSTVELVADPDLDDRDEHGRLLRYLVLAGGGNANIEAVRQGAAVPYFFRKERGAHARDLEAAREQAQDARRGLWAACPEAQVDPYRGSLTGPAR
ncbi:MAG: thermonuclease family protein [Gaiella sp.]